MYASVNPSYAVSIREDLRKLRANEGAFRTRVLEIVQLIPHGRVLSYGDVATLAGHARAARAVGTILKNTDHDEVPWQRVINAQMRISGGGRGARAFHQRTLLQGEGLEFDDTGRIETPEARWPLPEAWDAWHASGGLLPETNDFQKE